VLGAHASVQELVADVDRVSDIDSEGYGSPALAILEPMLDNVADQRVGIHARCELANDVITLLGAYAPQVRVDRRINPRRYKMPLLDKLGDLRRLDHRVE
jgi:hypothetical protein